MNLDPYILKNWILWKQGTNFLQTKGICDEICPTDLVNIPGTVYFMQEMLNIVKIQGINIWLTHEMSRQAHTNFVKSPGMIDSKKIYYKSLIHTRYEYCGDTRNKSLIDTWYE